MRILNGLTEVRDLVRGIDAGRKEKGLAEIELEAPQEREKQEAVGDSKR